MSTFDMAWSRNLVGSSLVWIFFWVQKKKKHDVTAGQKKWDKAYLLSQFSYKASMQYVLEILINFICLKVLSLKSDLNYYQWRWFSHCFNFQSLIYL